MTARVTGTMNQPMDQFAEPIERISSLCARVCRGEAGVGLAREIEDLLCDGYAVALQMDSGARRLERRRRELAARAETDLQAETELSDVQREQASMVRRASETRERLSGLRERFVSLGGAEATRR